MSPRPLLLPLVPLSVLDVAYNRPAMVVADEALQLWLLHCILPSVCHQNPVTFSAAVAVAVGGVDF